MQGHAAPLGNPDDWRVLRLPDGRCFRQLTEDAVTRRRKFARARWEAANRARRSAYQSARRKARKAEAAAEAPPPSSSPGIPF